MGVLLLVSLAMINIPAYRVIGRLLFGRQERLLEAIHLWASLEALRNPGFATEASGADIRLAAFTGASAALVLAEFLLLAEYVFRLVL